MKKLFSSILFYLFFLQTLASDLPIVDFKEAKNMNDDVKYFIQRLIRYTCDGALKYSQSKNFVPKIYDYSFIRGKNIEYSFRMAFDRADNHAEMVITQTPENELKAYIPKDTHDGLCILGKFYLKDIESYETNLE